MSNTHRIEIEPTSLGDSGQRYLVRHTGTVLIESSRNPEFDGARALLNKGVSGSLEVWRPNSSSPAMRIDIVVAAGLTVEDSDRVGLIATCSIRLTFTVRSLACPVRRSSKCRFPLGPQP